MFLQRRPGTRFGKGEPGEGSGTLLEFLCISGCGVWWAGRAPGEDQEIRGAERSHIFRSGWGKGRGKSPGKGEREQSSEGRAQPAGEGELLRRCGK